MILYDSDEAATYRTGISGWVDRSGFFYGPDEHSARLQGCTHKKCECGNVILKYDLRCRDCNSKRVIDRYNECKRVEWNLSDLLYSETYDTYIDNVEHLREFVLEHIDHEDVSENDIADLRLYICTPNFLPEVTVDYFEDVRPDDIDDFLSDEVIKAIDQLNEVISKQPPASWAPSDRAPSYGQIMGLVRD